MRWLLSHRAGLPVLDEPLTAEEIYAWDPIVEALAAKKPEWEPGTTHGYHAVTYGNLVGEVVRRITGKSIGRFVADEVAGPLGAEFYIGLPDALEPRVATMITAALGATEEQQEMFKNFDVSTLPEEIRPLVQAFLDPTSMSSRALSGISSTPMDPNSPAMHAAEMPAANGICTARGLARLYAGLVSEVDGVRLLTDETIANATAEQSNGNDAVLMIPTRFGLGYFLPSSYSELMGGGSFGHSGAGGSLGLADPATKIGFGYVMNKMQMNLGGDNRTTSLIDAVKASI